MKLNSYRWLVTFGVLLISAALTGCAGSLPAVGDLSVDLEAVEVEVSGPVDAIASDGWTVSGQLFAVNAQTEIHDLIAVGDQVKIHALVALDGSLTAREIELLHADSPSAAAPGEEIEFVGAVEAISADSWTIAGQTVRITPQTELKGSAALGDLVKVHAQVQSDGTLVAREIELATGDEVADDGEPFGRFIGTVELIGAESWTISGNLFLITPDTEIKDAIEVGDTVKVEATRAADGSLVAREIELEHDDDPAAGLPGEEIEFYGIVNAIGSGSWTVRDLTLLVTSSTEFEGAIQVGSLVEVHAIVNADGTLTAREIELAAEASDDDNSGSGSDSGSGDDSDDDSDDSDDDSGGDD